VVLRDPEEQRSIILKKIVAVENDVLKFNDEWIKIPKGQCWIEGINDKVRQVDSTKYGPVSMSLIEGKVEAVVWPWSKIGWISHPDSGSSQHSQQWETFVQISRQGLEAGKEIVKQVGEVISPSENDDGKKKPRPTKRSTRQTNT